jgi:hypothetical protein
MISILIIFSFITSVNKTTQQGVNLIVIKPVTLFATIIKFPLLLYLQRRFSLPLPHKETEQRNSE